MAKQGQLDWGEIRNTYATTDLSLRKIAKKYNCSATTVTKKAKRDNWAADRERVRDKRLSATAEAQGAALAEGVQQCVHVASLMLKRIQKRVEEDENPILPVEYRQLMGAIKDIRDVLQSDLDIQKKKADIDAVRRQLGEGKDNTVRVIIEGGADYDG